MRILQVHTRYRQAGGEDAAVETEYAMLVDAGHTVARFELQNSPDALSAFMSLSRSPWNTSASAGVLEAARAHRADVVHVHNTWYSLSPQVFPALKAAGFPVVATIHNYRLACVNALLYRKGAPCEDCVGRLPWRGVVRRCYRDSALQSGAVAVTIAVHRLRRTWEGDVDVIIALTRFASEVLKRSGIPESRIVVKPNVASDPGPRPDPPSRGDNVLFVGRLTEDKGVLDLIEAWSSQAPPGLRLSVIGDGPLLDHVRTTGGIGVEVLGRLEREEVRRRMLSSRALVLPSRWFEGMPMVLVEAMAAGLPVVVSDHGAMVEIAGSGGIAFAGGDVHSLADALHRVSDDMIVDSRGEDSRKEYRERFSPGRGLEDLVRIYQRACDGG